MTKQTLIDDLRSLDTSSMAQGHWGGISQGDNSCKLCPVLQLCQKAGILSASQMKEMITRLGGGSLYRLLFFIPNNLLVALAEHYDVTEDDFNQFVRAYDTASSIPEGIEEGVAVLLREAA